MSRHGHPLRFGPDGIADCRESGWRYRLEDETVRCLDLDEEHASGRGTRHGTRIYDSFKADDQARHDS